MFRLRQHRRKAPIVICALCTALIAGWYFAEHVHFSSFKPLESLDLTTQDYLTRYFGKGSTPRAELVYLAIDRDSIQLDQFAPEEIAASPALSLMKQGWPWSRAVYPLILKRLIDSGAKVVAMDLLFPTPREGDEAFRAGLDQYRRSVVIGSNFVAGKFEANDMKSHQLPADSLIAPTAPMDDRVGFVNFWPDSDKVIRRAHYGITASEVFQDPPEVGEEVFDSLAAKTLRKAGHAELIPAAGAHRLRFAGKASTFIPHSVSDIFDAKNWVARYGSGEFFHNKIVVLGPEGNFLKDVVRTPLDEMPGPELHLNALNAALNRDFISETSETANYLLIVSAGMFAWLLCVNFPAPLYRLGLLALVGAAWLVIAQIFYNDASLLILIFSPLVALGSSGVCCLSWDFFIERREKNRVRRTLERYVSKAAVKEIIDNPASFFHTLGGERKPVAILFTDLRGFTSLTERADSHALLAQLNEYFGAMVEPILSNHGSLDKFIGDAIMAVWGNIQSRGPAEDVRSAVTTGLLMRESLARLNVNWKAAGKPPLAMGMGINYGEAIVGNVGSLQQMNLTVIGDTVNLASRIEGVTKEYGIDFLLGEDAAALVRDFFHLQSAGLVQVKGRRRPVELFAVLGERTSAVDEAQEEYLQVYAEGMALYRSGEFSKAGVAFAQSLTLRPANALSQTYVKRSALLVQTPPADWNGVFVMADK